MIESGYKEGEYGAMADGDVRILRLPVWIGET